ncbi:DUF6286 domain-containing protein [Naasia lichenicola]|uniref:Alkaline shock response membrane anchor protein AmaP n=1 Tax=Naasia lichenicola TaxID=2565933 RepID=A0A4S4FIT7_9MICO|nr:DUF6286 domain-containing protein [Naasia lichenicola]THG30011.1 hypothetical protein E6C64_15330 [Naasia lichenicola]
MSAISAPRDASRTVPTPHGVSDDLAGIHRRILRRETHSPRSLLAISLAILLMVVFAWIAAELIVGLLGYPALLVAPIDMFRSALAVPLLEGTAQSIAVVSSALVLLIGIALIVASLAAGRRARHMAQTDRAAAVVDNEVIASALARHAARAAGISPDSTSVSVGHRRAVIELTPVSGHRLDVDEITRAAREQLDGYALRPRLAVSVRVASTGKVGS